MEKGNRNGQRHVRTEAGSGDVMLLALKMEEEAKSQGMWAASKR